MNELAKAIARNILRDDPETEFRIADGIETNRKGFATVELLDPDGKEPRQADIAFRQVRHEFHFGCNCFMLGQFKEAERNARYEAAFADLFNLAVVPFYWAGLEPEDGKPRFGKDSPPLHRRPPPDLALEFCARNHLAPKGHPLCWHTHLPEWLPHGPKALAARLERRFQEIAARYADKIRIWDVVNEALQWNPLAQPMPEHHVELAFELAAKHFPASSCLTLNDGPHVSWGSYHGDYTPLYLLARSLQARGAPLRALGLQYHMSYARLEDMPAWAEGFANPRGLLACLDQYAKLGVPLNVSEVTIPAHRGLGDGDRFQALVAAKLYRLWFSHPATNGVIWWNLADNTAESQGEDEFRGGLLDQGLAPKPVHAALRRLIKEEWTTRGSLAYGAGKPNQFHGFHGDYELTVKTGFGTFSRHLALSKGAVNHFKIQLG